MKALMIGDFNDAEGLALQALEVANKVGDSRGFSRYWSQIYMIRRDRGSPFELGEEAKTAIAKYPSVVAWRAALVLVLVESGCTAEARDALAEILPFTTEDSFFISSLSILAESCNLLNDVGHSRVVYDQLVPYRERNVVSGTPALFLGSAAHYLGILAAVMENPSDAASHFVHALHAHEKAGARPLAARTRYEYGKVLGRLGRKEEARAQLTAAIAEFEAMGMVVCLQRAREALGVLDCGPAREGRRPAEVAADSVPGGAADEQAVFRPDGDFWTVSSVARRRA
jgi:hypothetical protein